MEGGLEGFCVGQRNRIRGKTGQVQLKNLTDHPTSSTVRLSNSTWGGGRKFRSRGDERDLIRNRNSGTKAQYLHWGGK